MHIEVLSDLLSISWNSAPHTTQLNRYLGYIWPRRNVDDNVSFYSKQAFYFTL